MKKWPQILLEIIDRLNGNRRVPRGKTMMPIPVPALSPDVAQKLRSAARPRARR